MTDTSGDTTTIESSTRRPIRTRQWPIFKRLAQSLADRSVSPNTISVMTIVIGVVGVAFMGAASESNGFLRRILLLGAVLTVLLRLIGNLLDGMVAERAGSASFVGRLYNEGPDRITDILFLSGFGLLGYSQHAILLGAFAACFAVLTAYVRKLSSNIDAPPPFIGPMAKPQRMAILTFSLLVLVMVPESWVVDWGGIESYGLVEWSLVLIIIGSCTTSLRRWWMLVRFAKNVDRNRIV